MEEQPDDIGEGGDLQLEHQARAMRLHCPRADPHFPRDFLVRQPERKLGSDLPLALGEQVEPLLRFGERGAFALPLLGHLVQLPDPLEQHADRDGLLDEVYGTGADRSHRGRDVAVRAQHQDGVKPGSRPHGLENLKAVHLGHPDVEQDDTRLEFVHRIEKHLAVLESPSDHPLMVNGLLEKSPDPRLVVRDVDVNCHCACPFFFPIALMPQSRRSTSSGAHFKVENVQEPDVCRQIDASSPMLGRTQQDRSASPDTWTPLCDGPATPSVSKLGRQ